MRLTSHSFSNLLLRPLRQSGSFVLFNYLLLLFVMLPAYWRNAVATKMSLFSFAEAFADLYLPACFLLCLPNRRRVAQSVLTLVNLTTVAADCFVRIHFHTFINSAMLRLMLETNSNEAGSFLSTYIFQPTTLLFLLPFIGRE